MKTFIFNHSSFETALRVENYPYGRLRTSIFYWLETTPKKGDRFCSCTINPKNGRVNAPKKSTYANIGAMYLDEKNHCHWDGVTIYTNQEKLNEWIKEVGIENLNPDQIIQLKQLRGEKVVFNRDAITGDAKKDFSVKWEKDASGNYSEVKITFDRPDRVSVGEIFKAITTLNKEKLEKVFSERKSQFGANGVRRGIVRICVRGGIQLTTVSYEGYQEYLASDHTQE